MMKMNEYTYWQFDFQIDKLSEITITKEKFQSENILSILPEGVFTTFRTINKSHAFQLTNHFQRMVDSIQFSDLTIPYSMDELRKPIKQILKTMKGISHRVRLQIAFKDLSKCNIIIEELFPYPQEVYDKGVFVKTNHLVRQNPKAKRSDFISKSQVEKALLNEHGLEESLLVNKHQSILEGLSSNFFAVKENKLWTANQDILEGITRNLLLEEANRLGIEIIYKAIQYSDIEKLQEAFITSTSRGIMPVVKIDSKDIQNGMPGKITKQLINAYNRRFLNEFEEI